LINKELYLLSEKNVFWQGENPEILPEIRGSFPQFFPQRNLSKAEKNYPLGQGAIRLPAQIANGTVKAPHCGAFTSLEADGA
jgi:hypothetical protein